MFAIVAVLALIVFFYSVVADYLESTVVGGAITFTAVGLIVGLFGQDALKISLNIDVISTLAEMALALLLFVDAAGADLKELRRSISLPKRLLIFGLPLTIGAGILSGVILFDSLTFFEIALIGTILAPTDAALGKAVVTDEKVPNRIRTSLNVESGLNDGICVPIFLTFLAFAVSSAGDRTFLQISSHLIVEEIGIGAVVGIVVAFVGGTTIKLREKMREISPTWRQLLVPALALASYATAQALGGSGFIAAFVGGLMFSWLAQEKTQGFLLAAEGTGDTVTLLTWVIFGMTVVPRIFSAATWEIVAYAILSLTLVRMLPVWLCLKGSGLNLNETLFIGWFGPRGLASIVFVVMAIHADLPGSDLIASTVACTILLSVILHGLSAQPLIGNLWPKTPSTNV